jgi:DNA-binding PadR family transcriptional regulator
MVKGQCPIWGTQASLEKDGSSTLVDSARVGVGYAIERIAIDDYLHNRVPIGEAEKARITTWIIDQCNLGVDRPRITSQVVSDALRSRPLLVRERGDRLLRYIRIQLPKIGDLLRVSNREPADGLLAWSESTTREEIQYLLDYLVKSGVVEPIQRALEVDLYTISPAGHAYLAELETKAVNKKQAFVAMWFDSSMDEVYRDGIALGVRDAGYEPLRIDNKDHNNRIDDELIAEIRRSRFVVADFTQGASGARGGVYYEAGFAHGLNIPVIFTCRQDAIHLVHFDTRQYNYIAWGVPGELRRALMNRISATIGDGPLRERGR